MYKGGEQRRKGLAKNVRERGKEGVGNRICIREGSIGGRGWLCERKRERGGDRGTGGVRSGQAWPDARTSSGF